jgi:hypothetical protein
LLSDKVYPQNELQKYIVTSKLSALSVSVRTVFLFSGGQIWCEIISELKVGTELLSSFTIQESSKSEPCSPDSSEYKENDEIDMEVKAEVLSPPSLIPTSPITTSNVINHGI